MNATPVPETPVAPAASVAKEAASIVPKPRTDKQIWGIYIALCFISLVELYSASSHEVTASNIFAPVLRHAMLLGIGLCFMIALQRTHYSRFFNASIAFTVISFVAMVYTLFFGDFINGARRSFSLVLFAVQPAEMIKLSAALIIARVLSTSQVRGRTDVKTSGLVWVAGIVILFGGLLITQGLTNTILLMAISLSMMLVGGVSWKKFWSVVGIYMLIAFLFFGFKAMSDSGNKHADSSIVYTTVPGTDVKVAESNQESQSRDHTWEARLKRFFKSNKYEDKIDDKNQQEQYSYIAQAHGGLYGVGVGNSRETARLPLAFSDYIYAIIIEEGGLLFGMFVLILYLWLLMRAGFIAARCRTAFPALLVTGMAVFIAYQALFHMAIVTGVFPVSGQPLPLISKGGTSILITSVALGIMLSVSRFAARKGVKEEIREELSTLPENASAENI